VDLGEATVLGIVQGLTEFIPVSSTAHLRIIPAFVGWKDPGSAYTAVIQLGTMAAILIYFRQDLWRIARATLTRDGTHDAQMGWFIVLGTIPIGIVGLVFSDQIKTGARNLHVIGFALIALGLVLYAAERVSTRTRTREVESLAPRDATVIGLAQATALIPGVSRSGSTITAGLFLGFTREAAARYSFLLSIPAVVLSGLYELKDVGNGGVSWGATTVSTVIAFVVGYASIAFLLRFLASNSTLVFTIYRVIMGTTVLVLVYSNAIS
jgi:undecaprenyl-diphosphatase